MQLVVDDLTFEVRESSRRKTLEITVDRDGELLIAAPVGTDEQLLRDFVIERRTWIYQKLAQKAEQRRQLPQKEYVNGEGFLYLGRSYRLKCVPPDAQNAPLKLAAGLSSCVKMPCPMRVNTSSAGTTPVLATGSPPGSRSMPAAWDWNPLA